MQALKNPSRSDAIFGWIVGLGGLGVVWVVCGLAGVAAAVAVAVATVLIVSFEPVSGLAALGIVLVAVYVLAGSGALIASLAYLGLLTLILVVWTLGYIRRERRRSKEASRRADSMPD